MDIIRLKDLSLMTLDEAEIQPIASKFQTGEGTKQEAFQDLLDLSIEKLTPFTEDKRTGTKLLTGAMKTLTELMDKCLLATLGLSSTYCGPARQLARAAIEGGPDTLEFVVNNLGLLGDSHAGDLPGPVFAPSRLIVSMKNLRLPSDKSLFKLDDNEDNLMLKDKNGVWNRFASMSIEAIKNALRTGTTDVETLGIISALVGEFTEQGAKEKPGAIGREVVKLIKAATANPEEPDQFALDVAEKLIEARDFIREASITRIREDRAEQEAKADMERAQKRLAKQAELGASRERVGASVANPDTSESSDD
jgi:hypothetical protein